MTALKSGVLYLYCPGPGQKKTNSVSAPTLHPAVSHENFPGVFQNMNDSCPKRASLRPATNGKPNQLPPPPFGGFRPPNLHRGKGSAPPAGSRLRRRIAQVGREREKTSGRGREGRGGREGAGSAQTFSHYNKITILGRLRTNMKQNSKRRQTREKGQSRRAPDPASRRPASPQPLPAPAQPQFLHLELQIPAGGGLAGGAGGCGGALSASGPAREVRPPPPLPGDCLAPSRTAAFPGKPQSNDKSTIHQQYEHSLRPEKATRTAKASHRPTPTPAGRPLEESSHSTPLQKMEKQQSKLAKRVEKEQREGWAEGWAEGEGSRAGGEAESQQLLEIVSRLYPFYLVNGRIAYPIEDSLLHPPHCRLGDARAGCLEKLDDCFPLELQLWNTLVEYPAFFGTDPELTVEELGAMLKEAGSLRRLFKAFHNFYLNDVLVHRYEEGAGEDYHSFVSLWRYADENGFLDKLFHTAWNKFMLLYVSQHGRSCRLEEVRGGYLGLEEELGRQLREGEFEVPLKYQQLLQYLVFLNDMSFETQSFKALINNKMLFFRDNNKLKNELLDQKKAIENHLAAIRDAEKALLKREKTALKLLKKEQKSRNPEAVAVLRAELEAVETEKHQQMAMRTVDLANISEIDNKTYELCCLPEFSNVWLLGEDRDRNLYWFIKEQDAAIYREDKEGRWSSIRDGNIDRFHATLNPQGIRERKLHDKINYYKQLGYIRTDNPPSPAALSHEDSSPVGETSSNKGSSVGVVVGYDGGEFEKFSYMEMRRVTPAVIKMMILKSEWMMTKYLYERNSKWHTDDHRQEYINRMLHHDLQDLPALTHELRTFNEKICVVEINIRASEDAPDIKTRKIQTKIWGINEKYKHFWYDYSRKCHTLSDLHFLVSVLYLTIEKYVTKTRKPNNTKYFYKTMEFTDHLEPHDNEPHDNEHHDNEHHPHQEQPEDHQEQPEDHQQEQQEQQEDHNHYACDGCQHVGELQSCPDCEHMLHDHCLSRHQQESCQNRDAYRSVSPLI